MSIAVRVEPLVGNPSDVEYRWDADTDILTANLRTRQAGDGASGSVEIEGSDGSWLILDLNGGSDNGIASIEMNTAMAAEADDSERTIHFRLGPSRQTKTVRIARDILIDVDGKDRIAGVWLLGVPPFPEGQ